MMIPTPSPFRRGTGELVSPAAVASVMNAAATGAARGGATPRTPRTRVWNGLTPFRFRVSSRVGHSQGPKTWLLTRAPRARHEGTIAHQGQM
jgi:hypothetical protein